MWKGTSKGSGILWNILETQGYAYEEITMWKGTSKGSGIVWNILETQGYAYKVSRMWNVRFHQSA